jgi:hypothetical protein
MLCLTKFSIAPKMKKLPDNGPRLGLRVLRLPTIQNHIAKAIVHHYLNYLAHSTNFHQNFSQIILR